MGKYVVTGSASGMGLAVADKLRAEGHDVIGVDLKDADVTADLSTADGRARAIRELLAALDGVLDGAVFAAGVGPRRGNERTTVEVNVLGTTELLTALRPKLAAAGNAKVVVFGSNSTTSTPFVPRRAISLLDEGNTERATKILRRRGPLSGPAAYAASKLALSRWVRRAAASPEFAGAGVRVNIIAPGPVLTPLLKAQLEGASGNQVRSLPVPVREHGTPEQLAQWVMVMLSPAADFMVGSVVTVDGGTEALLRTKDWPSPMPLKRVPKMLNGLRQAKGKGQVADYSDA
ncbi:SDR family oxidoreductase [Gordonia sp. (in: high G+C Gram-positive bacteria)]|uniref:SDR family oxidoreductase n=1 Tax=Gordonia sp. (in: high G+C Gram-positive bacteria) TaxID=84139 RepID=UPI003C790B4A